MCLQEGFALGVILIEQAGVIEVGFNPFLEVFEIAEIDDKAVGVGLATGKGQGDRPVVAVDEGAMPRVQMLAVREGDVAVGFLAGEHDAIKKDWRGASGWRGGFGGR